jgi:putative FmdB family regulatory protein
MPIYGYVCTQCGHEFEVLQGINEMRLKSCPECMGPLQKLLYPVGVIYKGSGFYTTDYKGSSKGTSGDGGGRSEKGDKVEKSEKPAAKAESDGASKAKDAPAS